MRVRASDDPIPDQRVEERDSSGASRATRHDAPKQRCDLARARAAEVLVLLVGVDAECLAQVLLVEPELLSALDTAVVARDDDRRLSLEAFDTRPNRTHPDGSHRGQTEVFVEVMLVEALDRGLQDVRRCDRAVWITPLVALTDEGGFRLRACEAEPARGPRAEPGGLILAQVSQPAGDCCFPQPLDLARSPARGHLGDAFLGNQPNRSSAVFADRRCKQRKWSL